jgi:WhiB family redox-sensing transcriptional regulator
VPEPLDWDDSGWRDRAACRDSAPDLFFPVGSTGAALEEARAAKAVCGTCAVREQCLAFALETNQEAGIWGGASEEERRALRRHLLAGRRAALVSR